MEEAFRTHGTELFLYLARYCGDPHMAKDGVQETFIRLQHSPPDHGEATKRWLFRTGTNVVRDMLRISSTRTRLLREEAHRVPRPEAPSDPHERLERREDAARVRGALAGLRDKERVALLMREAGFRHREIAAELETTTASVGTLLARSLAKLADALGEGG